MSDGLSEVETSGLEICFEGSDDQHIVQQVGPVGDRRQTKGDDMDEDEGQLAAPFGSTAGRRHSNSTTLDEIENVQTAGGPLPAPPVPPVPAQDVVGVDAMPMVPNVNMFGIRTAGESLEMEEDEDEDDCQSVKEEDVDEIELEVAAEEVDVDQLHMTSNAISTTVISTMSNGSSMFGIGGNGSLVTKGNGALLVEDDAVENIEDQYTIVAPDEFIRVTPGIPKMDSV